VSSLAKVILQRLGLGLLTLFVVSLIIAFVVELLPGDITQALLGQSATPETVAAFRAEIGLDRPAHIRYLEWLKGMLTGDMGKSLASKRDITEFVGTRLSNTLFLGGVAAAIAVPFALFLGLLAALYRNSIYDRIVNLTTLTSISFPEFFVAYILILFLSVKSGIFPGISNVSTDLAFSDKLFRTILPALTLTLVVLAHMLRMTRAAIINLLSSPYIEMAHLKGTQPFRVIVRHALPNAWGPIVNVIALNLAYLISGIVVIETLFNVLGLGRFTVESVQNRDIPAVQVCAMIFCAVYVLLNLLADVISIIANPRLRHPK